MLYGFSQVILQGALVTLELALSSVVLAVLIGLAALAQSYRATVHWRWCLKAIPL
ncbi:Histidine ABC transporter [Klebsiella pneumoniae subsp. ozaenae]|uniref:Histidine ABC transporter n=1 Tax=Klebsiella pneumoniae subsp. ozaenae TaxID=574 RepID=A0A378A262_KLEPO|nr:Histidine ABC transporter [Klebsiella pneumoniae subsp. ozaenae]